MNILLVATFVFAVLEGVALQKNWSKLEWLAKPAVMLCLFVWLFTTVGLSGATLWFGLGILLSLLGDILLMISLDRFFLYGLITFLLAHVFYVIGFNIPIPGISAWSVILAILIGWGGARVIRRILTSVAASGNVRMSLPIIVYSVVISLMLLSAMIKLNDLSWNAGASLLVALGAFLFYISDVILAWNKFVSPIQHGRIYNIAVYHLGQITLIAGVIVQYSA